MLIYVIGAASIIALVVGLLWWMRRDSRNIGAMEATQDGMKQEIYDVQKVKLARDSFLADLAASSKLRDKYTRK